MKSRIYKHRRQIQIAILASMLQVSPAFSASEPLLEYNSVYKGIQVGVSNTQDVINQLGNPTSTSTVNKNIHYQFGNVQVTIMATTGVVESITISDRSYVDANGIKIGTPRSSVEAILKKKSFDTWTVDKQRGIIYWIADDKVSKIVLPYKILDK